MPSAIESTGPEYRRMALHGALHCRSGFPPSAWPPLAWRSRSNRSSTCSTLAASALGPASRPGSISCAAPLAAARPKTTISSSEFEPRRLAPCTDTQAASPIAISPGTTVSGSPSLTGDHFAVVVGRDAAHVVVCRGQHRDRLLGRHRHRRKCVRFRLYPAAVRGCTSGPGVRDEVDVVLPADRRRGPRESRSSWRG